MKTHLKNNKILHFLLQYTHVVAAVIWSMVAVSRGYSLTSLPCCMGLALIAFVHIESIAPDIDFPECMPEYTENLIVLIATVLICFIWIGMVWWISLDSLTFLVLLFCEIGTFIGYKIHKRIKNGK